MPIEAPGPQQIFEIETLVGIWKSAGTVGVDQNAKIWDVVTGEELLSLESHTSNVYGMNFSPDSKYLVTTSWDQTIRVHILDSDLLIANALARVKCWFTPAECLEFLHTETCPPDPRP